MIVSRPPQRFGSVYSVPNYHKCLLMMYVSEMFPVRIYRSGCGGDGDVRRQGSLGLRHLLLGPRRS